MVRDTSDSDATRRCQVSTFLLLLAVSLSASCSEEFPTTNAPPLALIFEGQVFGVEFLKRRLRFAHSLTGLESPWFPGSARTFVVIT